jgi:AcrR family transcriptional regulator
MARPLGTQASKAKAKKPRVVAAAAPPPARARLDVDERRAQLLALGLAMFSERAYDEVAVDDLARAAGVSKGLLYHYFPTKRDLYVAAIGEASRRLLEETTGQRDGAPEERLRRGLSTYLDFVERHGKAYVALMRGGVGSDPEVAGILEETRRTFAAQIFHDVPQESATPLVQVAVRGWIGFVEATSLDWVARRAVQKDDLIELLAGVIFDAVARAGRPPSGPSGIPEDPPNEVPSAGRFGVWSPQVSWMTEPSSKTPSSR